MATRYAFYLSSYEMYGDPQIVGEHIDALIDEKKEHVTADEIVADARKHTSPLREFFTWDDKEAAEKWRRKEAKSITRNLVLAKGKQKTKTTAFVYVHHPEHQGKRVLMARKSAMARPDMRAELREKAVSMLRRSLSYWGGAYGGTPELEALAANVTDLVKRIEKEYGNATAAV